MFGGFREVLNLGLIIPFYRGREDLHEYLLDTSAIVALSEYWQVLFLILSDIFPNEFDDYMCKLVYSLIFKGYSADLWSSMCLPHRLSKLELPSFLLSVLHI